jgi:hypothetical protein
MGRVGHDDIWVSIEDEGIFEKTKKTWFIVEEGRTHTR